MTDHEAGVSAQALDRAYREVCECLFREAQLLDAGRYDEWLTGLDADIRYRLTAPTLQSARAGGRPPAAEVVLMDETLASLRTRIQQLLTAAYTVADNPRGFTRRFVSNVLIESADGDQRVARSNVLVYRTRGGLTPAHLFSMTRLDVLRQHAGHWRLTSREAVLDESVIEARSLVALF